MNLTKQEREKMQANIEGIKEYIETQICPKLKGERVSIDFGEIKRFANGSSEHEYHFYVRAEGASGRSGYLPLALLPTGLPSSCGSSFCERYDAGIELLRAWPRIKATLLEAVKKVEETENMIDTFEV